VEAHRVGKSNDNQYRLVIVKFKNPDDKFMLFQYREVLQSRGIRISNDILYLQRQQLKDLNKRGLNGYFKGGKLVSFPKNPDQNGISSRLFRRGAPVIYMRPWNQHPVLI
jgi:hypothetical protein